MKNYVSIVLANGRQVEGYLETREATEEEVTKNYEIMKDAWPPVRIILNTFDNRSKIILTEDALKGSYVTITTIGK